jgi:hypothetical protein
MPPDGLITPCGFDGRPGRQRVTVFFSDTEQRSKGLLGREECVCNLVAYRMHRPRGRNSTEEGGVERQTIKVKKMHQSHVKDDRRCGHALFQGRNSVGFAVHLHILMWVLEEG